MSLPIFSRFAVFAALAAALSAQPELKYSTPADRFAKLQFTQAVITNVSGGLEVRALDRKDLFIEAPLWLPTGHNFVVTRVVVHFRNPGKSSAALVSVRLTSEYGSKLLDVQTYAQNDRFSSEVYEPARSANAWRIRPTTPPTTVNTKTIVRLGIGSSLPIDPEGSGPPPPNYRPRGEPFVLISVDVYVKNPI